MSPRQRPRQRRRSRPPRSRRPPGSWRCCSRRSRWCADSALLLIVGHWHRTRVRAHRGLGGVGPRRPAAVGSGSRSAPQPAIAGRRRRFGARSGEILGEPGRVAVSSTGGSGRTGRGGGGCSPSRPRPARRPGARRGRMGRRHPDAGPVGRDQARALEHAGAARTCERSSTSPASRARSTWSSSRANVATPKTISWMVATRTRCWPTSATSRRRGARARPCARRCRCPTCSARAHRRGLVRQLADHRG